MLSKFTNLKGNVLEIRASSNQQMTFCKWGDRMECDMNLVMVKVDPSYMCMCEEVQ